MDHHLWKRNSNSRHYMVEKDLQLWFLDKSECLSRKKPKISKQIDIDQHQPLLASLSEALNDYEDFPEPHLNSNQLQHLGGLLDYLFWRYNLYKGHHSPCLSWSSHQQIFWHRSRSGRWIFYPTNWTKNQLRSRTRTWRCCWTGKLQFQEENAVFIFTPRTNHWVVGE